MNDLAAAIGRLAPQRGPTTAIPGLYILHSSEFAIGDKDLTEPLLCVLALGRKRIMLGETAFEYDPDHYVIVSASVPITGYVLEEPYLGTILQIDRALLAEVIAEMPVEQAEDDVASSLAVHALDARLADALCRLVALSERPADIPVLGSLLKREIYYYLLAGPAGRALRQVASKTSRLAQIGSAIDEIRRNYAQPLRMSDLARAAHMSPLQFQKQLRLQEARRMLIAERTDVAGIGAAVGYESPSQFSREYRRFFGTPPSGLTRSA